MIRHWPPGARKIWTDYIFLHSRERIAVRIVFDNATGKLVIETYTKGRFVVDEEQDRVVGQEEKPIVVEFEGKALGAKGHWPIVIAVPTEDGATAKLLIDFSA